jgi:chloride channel protein, CIC family
MNAEKRLRGVITRGALQKAVQQGGPNDEDAQLGMLVTSRPIVAYSDEPLRAAVNRMAETGFTRLPVIERDEPQKLLGVVSLSDLLKARVRNVEEERQRERVLHVRLLGPRRKRATRHMRK